MKYETYVLNRYFKSKIFQNFSLQILTHIIIKTKINIKAIILVPISNEAMDLINKIIKPQNQRLTLKQIFEHPWMKKR
jgi:hypothetical protein